jgi:hypothetical protein
MYCMIYRTYTDEGVTHFAAPAASAALLLELLLRLSIQ